MKRILTGALAALTLAGGALGAAAPAAAEGWHGDGGGWRGGDEDGWREHGDHGGWREHGGGWGSGAAVGAGILGLAVGASLASHPYYGGGYYAPGYYGAGDYAPPACHGAWRWNPYWGSYQRVRVCD